MVKQYESRLAAKKQEVIELQNQRDDLRRTHDRLMLLQSQLLVPGVSLSLSLSVSVSVSLSL